MTEYELVCQAMPYVFTTFDSPAVDVERHFPAHLWHSTRGYVIDSSAREFDEHNIREATL